jgi:cob(I)alamin adenosyltransferase
MAKIYTRTGDKGMSSLRVGVRISKASARMSAYGSIDELNSYLGVLLARRPDTFIKGRLKNIQKELMVIGTDLATPYDGSRVKKNVRIKELAVKRLESEIDKMNKSLNELKNFIIPGGSELGAEFHFARTICRRVERKCVRLSEEDEINPVLLKYVNRLSDWLFTAARYQNKKDGISEEKWLVD